MPNEASGRDYSLTGANNARAVAAGLANAAWYRTAVSRPRLKPLMTRNDGPATRDFMLWFGLMALTGGLGIALWGNWLCVPVLAAYGFLYASGADSRWHEYGHGTAFKTPWKNEAGYQFASFMSMRNPTIWRWSHARHHTDTIIVGRDPEIVAKRPPNIPGLIPNLFGILDVPRSLAAMLRHAAGRLQAGEKDFVPVQERAKAVRVARVWVVIYAVVMGGVVASGSILPLMLVGLPRMYGIWHGVLCGVTQHVGLAEDVLDHRLNARTIYMNPVSRFIYCNMNYHVEHHMFPMVPFHQLPALHAEIRDDCPRPYDGFLDAYREIVPTLIRQRRDPTYFVHRPLPATAGGTTTRPVLAA